MMLLLLIASVLPHDNVARESCDRIEVNLFYDDLGRLVFEQHCFYDWEDHSGRFQLRAWRMVKNQTQQPRLNPQSKRWEVHWMDGEAERLISSPVLMRTATQYDPELTEREHLPKERRRELLNPKVLLK
jgi:hypothetical protein